MMIVPAFPTWVAVSSIFLYKDIRQGLLQTFWPELKGDGFVTSKWIKFSHVAWITWWLFCVFFGMKLPSHKDKVRCAVRSLVNPQVKQEGHSYKKVFKTHKGPDGKETFMLDEGSQDSPWEPPVALDLNSRRDRSRHQDCFTQGLYRRRDQSVPRDLRWDPDLRCIWHGLGLPERGVGCSKPFTELGPTVAIGGSALLAAHSALLDVDSPREAYRDVMTALAYVEVVNGSLYQQAEYGTCQTGSSWTTWVDNILRKCDLNCRFGIKLGGKAFLPVATYHPFLVERDIKEKG